MKVTYIDECGEMTLEQIKWLESVCRKQRKRLKSNTGKCNKTIDMFNDEDSEDE